MVKKPIVTLVAYTDMFLPKDGYPWEKWNCDSYSPSDSVVEFAGRLCYQSWNKPNASTSTNVQYVKNILDHGHYSVLEHAGFTVAIVGVSRACTHELVRHRHLSFSQLSQRYVAPSAGDFVVPPLFRGVERAEKLIKEHYERSLEVYNELLEIANERLSGLDLPSKVVKKRSREAARAVLPNSTATQIVVSGNHRAWREFLWKRGSSEADAEIREVAIQIFNIAKYVAPAIYQDMHVIDGCIVGPASSSRG